MVCINSLSNRPILSAMYATAGTFIYFIISRYSTALAPAIAFSIMSGLFIYMLMGGTIWCAETPDVSPPAPPAPQVIIPPVPPVTTPPPPPPASSKTPESFTDRETGRINPIIINKDMDPWD